MARGFESKSVESQQEEAQRARTLKPALTAEEQARAEQRQAIELALAAKRSELDAATNPAHRAYLERAISELSSRLSNP